MLHSPFVPAALASLAVSLAPAPLWAHQGPAAPPRQCAFAPDSILVRFDPSAPAPFRDAALTLVGADSLRGFATVPGLVHARITVPVAHALDTLRKLPFVLYAEPDFEVRPAGMPNDPLFHLQWGMHNTGQYANGDLGTPDADIDAPEAWDRFTGDPSFIVAVVDTGVNYLHPDLAANAWLNPGEIPANGIDDDGNGYPDDARGWDFFNEDPDPMDDHGHGTFCAGVAGAVGDNGVGIAGVNWRCKIMALKFIGANEVGYLSGAIGAIDYAVANGARVSSHSWGGYEFSQALHDAITAAHDAGHLLVAASGNNGNDNDAQPFYPASYEHDNVIAVGGVDNDDQMHPGFNYGATSVDLVAPGVNVYSLWVESYAFGTGTSAAAPHVAGAAALLLGRHTDWTYSRARTCILRNVRRLPALDGAIATGGVLDLDNALRRALSVAQPR